MIDSVAFHFRQNFSDMGLRTRLLNGMAQHLRRFADEYEIAVIYAMLDDAGPACEIWFLQVILMNQMTTRINRGEHSDSDIATLVPALGKPETGILQ